MRSLTKRVLFSKHAFDVFEEVYEPAEDSLLFADNLKANEGDVVLDMGTGCGILGIIAAEKAAQVIAIDINPHAVRCARENAILNHVDDTMFCIQGDLFAAIKNHAKFDLILFNAPYLPSEDVDESSWLESAWSGGPSGRRVIDRFVHDAPKYLKPRGRLLLLQSTLSNVNDTLEKLERENFTVTVVAEKALPFFETIKLVRAEFANPAGSFEKHQ
jgi:release factor glutamine methyltransferase